MKENRDRIFFLDNLCSVLLLHMIFVIHAGYSCGGYDNIYERFSTTFLSFFMAWFFFKGGIMHKIQCDKVLARKSAVRLLIPYSIFLIIGFVIDLLVSNFCWNEKMFSQAVLYREWTEFITTSTPISTRAIWFLPSLFFARIIFNFLVRKTDPKLIICCSVAVGYLMDYLNVPCYVGCIFHATAFYALGYCFRKQQFSRTLLIICIIAFVAKFIFPAEINFRSNHFVFSYLLAVIYEMTGCILSTFIFMKFLNREIPILTDIGKDSMVYYIVHYPVMFVTICVFAATDITLNYWQLFVIILLALSIAYFYNKLT